MRIRNWALLAVAVAGSLQLLTGPAFSQTDRTPAPIVHDSWAVKAWSDYPDQVAWFFQLDWKLKDSSAPAHHFQMRRRWDSPREVGSSWRRSRLHYQPKNFSVRGTRRMCAEVRAVYHHEVGPWSNEVCRTKILQPMRFKGWRRGPAQYQWQPETFHNEYFNANTIWSKDHGAQLRARHLHVHRLALWGLKCPKCGSLRVELGHHVIGRIDLRGHNRHPTKLWHRVFDRPLRGTLTLTVTSHGRLVRIDGVMIERDSHVGRRP